MKQLLIPQATRAGATRIWQTFRAGLMAVLISAGLSPAASAGVSGAIFTTDITGTIVNQNLYDSRQDVYLNGGPQNKNAAGLTPGIYYFQVTDPSGAELLSTDNAECRMLIVNAQGRVAGAYDGGADCEHANGDFNPANGSTSVQLWPFKVTPNPGGVYKAWLIAAGEATVDPMDPKVLLFSNSAAKTDNFKVRREDDDKCELYVTVDDLRICHDKVGIAWLKAEVENPQNIPNLTFTWWVNGNPSPETSDTIIITEAGTYKVEVAGVTDETRCTDQYEATVEVLDDCELDNCSVEPAIVNVECGEPLPEPSGPECEPGFTLQGPFDGPIVAACGQTYEFVRKWVCLDEFTGLYSECEQTIRVADTTKPTISCPPDLDLQCLDEVPKADISSVFASDTCGEVTVSHVGDTEEGNACEGLLIKRVYKAVDQCENEATCTQLIYVKDTTKPSIQCPQDLNVQCPDEVPLPDVSLVTASDNCSDVTVEWVRDTPSGTPCDMVIKRVYKATDECGNKSYCIQRIYVKDTIGPTIKVTDKQQCYNPFDLSKNTVDVPAPEVTDNCSSGLTATGVRSDGLALTDPFPLGTTIIVWSAEDDCGNPSTVEQKITIKVCACKLVNGLSKGYWGNKNGSNTLSKKDDAWRKCINSLNLRKADGSFFTVGLLPGTSFANAYNPFNSWLQGATAVNMAYMLSAQLAAVKLDVEIASPPVNGNAVLFIPASLKTGGGAGIAATLKANNVPGFVDDIQGNGYIKINDLIAAAKTELGLHGLTTSSGPIRTYQEAMKDLLDAICNNAINTVCP